MRYVTLEWPLSLSVCRCSQTAGRNSCSIVSGDVSNCSYRLTLSRVRVSVRPSNFFIREKHPKPWGKRVASTCVYLNDPATGIVASGAGGHDWVPTNSDNLYGDGGVCVCVRACARVCACVMCLQYTIIIFYPG